MEAFFGSAKRSMEATTSSAVISLPLWNFTPLRILKVQTVPSSLGFQLSARTGLRWDRGRRPKGTRRAEQHHQPAIVVDRDGIDGARRHGGGSADGAAGLGGAGGRRKAAAPRPETPSAPAKVESSGMPRPSTEPWRRNSRRSIRPEVNSSTRSFSISVSRRRMPVTLRSLVIASLSSVWVVSCFVVEHIAGRQPLRCRQTI